jgi:hypothetical protein
MHVTSGLVRDATLHGPESAAAVWGPGPEVQETTPEAMAASLLSNRRVVGGFCLPRW